MSLIHATSVTKVVPVYYFYYYTNATKMPTPTAVQNEARTCQNKQRHLATTATHECA